MQVKVIILLVGEVIGGFCFVFLFYGNVAKMLAGVMLWCLFWGIICTTAPGD